VSAQPASSIPSAPSARPAAAEPVAARTPQLDRAASARLARVEFQRWARLLGQLTEADGAKPTECPEWDVRAMASHVLGMSEMFSSWSQNARQHFPAWRADRRGAPYIDALTAKQVHDRRDLSLPEIRAGLAAVAERNVRWRQRTPGLLRNRAMPDPQPVTGVPGGPMEAWTFGFLFDVILVRDPWMHRGDVSRAVGLPLELTADHDGAFIADVVGEWASRHAEPYDLTLSGPAGGHWSRGSGGEVMAIDAVEFARTVSGRRPGSGLLAVAVPF
jgi:uncharacterized protein (TIGR03083 family)